MDSARWQAIEESRHVYGFPEWEDSMSDGCTIFSMLPYSTRAELNDKITSLAADPLAVRAACVTHDRRYYYGGTRADREAADQELLAVWREAGVPEFIVILGDVVVRSCGGPEWRLAGVSWAFGGERFIDDGEPQEAA